MRWATYVLSAVFASVCGVVLAGFSGGEQQRVAIARAIVNKPQILLADEPTGNLDPTTSAGIMSLLERINAGGTTILMATHEAGIVDQMQRRVIELASGQIVRDERQGGYGRTSAIQTITTSTPAAGTTAAAATASTPATAATATQPETSTGQTATSHQAPRVIVDDFRRPKRSYRGPSLDAQLSLQGLDRYCAVIVVSKPAARLGLELDSVQRQFYCAGSRSSGRSCLSRPLA